MSAMNEITLEMIETVNAELSAMVGKRANTSSAVISATQTTNRQQIFPLPSNPETPAEIARINSILQFLSSDVPRGQGKLFDHSGGPANDYWLGVIWAGASLRWSCAKEMFRDWSKQSPLYTDDGFEDNWTKYNPQHPNPVGIASLIKFARIKGWAPPQQPMTLPTTQSAFQRLGRNDILTLPPTTWRVKNIFPEVGFGAVYGPSGSGKSFLAIDMACAIAAGEPWFGYKTHACDVTYLMLEGEAGLAARVQAWEAGSGKLLPDNFAAIKQPFRLTDSIEVAELVAVLPANGVVVIDTLNRAAPTSDENSSAEMGQILEGAKTLQLATNSLIIIVHHTGKDLGRGMRGHSSLFAAQDGAIEVSRADNNRSWNIAKSKDGEDGQVLPFRLKHHVLGQDADGDDITSCSVEPDCAGLFVPRQPQGDRQRRALQHLKPAISNSGLQGKGGCDAGTSCLGIDQAIEAVASALSTTQKNKRRNVAKGLINDLIKNGFLGSGIDDSDDGWLWQV